MDLQDEGNYMEAMETMERSLVFRRNYFGPDSDEVEDACRVLSEMCNLLAMTYLQNDDFATSHKLLQKAELFARNNLPRKAVTLNNFACMYRRRGDLRKALQSLRRAVRIETKLQTMGRVVDKAADTHLNLCAVLSQLSEHAEALGHAQQALILMQEELYPLPNLDNLTPEESEDLPLDRISVLCIAYVRRPDKTNNNTWTLTIDSHRYYNSAVEQEFLKKFGRAQRSYLKGLDIAETYLGPEPGMACTAYT